MRRLTPFLIDASRGVPDRCTNRLSYNSATYVPLRRAQTGLSSRASIYHTAIKRSRFVISLGWARTRRNYVLIISGAGERGQCRIVIVAGHYASLRRPRTPRRTCNYRKVPFSKDRGSSGQILLRDL